MTDDTYETSKKTRGRPPKGWRRAFLNALADGGIVGDACGASGVSRATAYRARKTDLKFAERWDDAVDSACDGLELEARRRAVEGTEKPVFHAGKQVGTTREYSDVLLIFLLKAHRPEKFRDNYDSSKKLVELLSRAQRFVIPERDDRPVPSDV